jgi:hypothetical protein
MPTRTNTSLRFARGVHALPHDLETVDAIDLRALAEERELWQEAWADLPWLERRAVLRKALHETRDASLDPEPSPATASELIRQWKGKEKVRIA